MSAHSEDVAAAALLKNIAVSLKKMLKDKGYWCNRHNNFYFCSLQPCDWCRIHYQQIFLAKRPIIVGMFLRNDDLDDLDKCLLLLVNLKVDNLYELAAFHPMENCYFAQAILYYELTKLDNPIKDIILSRRLCTDFIAKDIVREYIKSRGDEGAYLAITEHGMINIKYWFMEDTTDEEIERFVDYFYALRRDYNNRNPDTTRRVAIKSSLSPYESVHIMPIRISEDTNTIYIRFPAYPVIGNISDVSCYHTSLRFSHCKKLIRGLCRAMRLDVDMNVKQENACPCDAEHIPFQPIFNQYYEQGEVVDC